MRFLKSGFTAALCALALAACSDRDAAEAEDKAPVVSILNFAGKWVFKQSEDQSKVIDLASNGTYVYEVRTGPDGDGDVLKSAAGTYEVDAGGNIRSLEAEPGSPEWTGIRRGDKMEFSLNGGEPFEYFKAD